ncbi:MAG: hypothetical protein AB9846_14085 [Tenuifilaceae bacterium]
MKKIAIIFLIAFWTTPLSVFCQNSIPVSKNELIGLWQSKTEKIGSAYLDNYSFFSNDRFIFRPTTFDGLRGIIEIKGSFKINDLTIIFLPDSITEITGTEIERSRISTLSDSWSLLDSKLIKSRIKSEPQEASLEKIIDADKKKYHILIDKREFFKIKDNPDK